MKRLLIICLLLSSCAHNYKKSEIFLNTPFEEVKISMGKNLSHSDQCSKDLSCDFKNTDDILNKLFSITSDDQSDLEITQIKTNLNTSGAQCLNGYPAWLALTVVSLGIIPVFNSSAIKAEVTVRNKKTNISKIIKIDADHTSGAGWLYWIRAWRGKDNWYWTSEKPQRYDNERVYFYEYGNWLLKTAKP